MIELAPGHKQGLPVANPVLIAGGAVGYGEVDPAWAGPEPGRRRRGRPGPGFQPGRQRAGRGWRRRPAAWCWLQGCKTVASRPRCASTGSCGRGWAARSSCRLPTRTPKAQGARRTCGRQSGRDGAGTAAADRRPGDGGADGAGRAGGGRFAGVGEAASGRGCGVGCAVGRSGRKCAGGRTAARGSVAAEGRSVGGLATCMGRWSCR